MDDGRAAYLEHRQAGDGRPHRVLVHRLPFRIGRSTDAELTVYVREVSTLHARIEERAGALVLVDLDSTNGTFVNGERIEERVLRDGDIVHVAEVELRFELGEPDDLWEPTIASADGRQQRLIRESNDLHRVMCERGVSAVFQPIVRLADGARVGYEALGRVTLPELCYDVGTLLRVAAERGQGARLSRMLREVALERLPLVPERPVMLFFNLHPLEMTDPARLLEVFRGIADALGPEQAAILEVHEGAVTDLGAMAAMRDALRDHGIGLAYDDFGAGQSRLMELVEVPPDILKLDMTLVRDLHASDNRKELVRALVKVVRDMGIRVLAEGIERPEEAATCEALGCELAQGYFFGRPRPLAEAR